MKPAVFLDRDGVIIENREAYVRSSQDVVFIPGALPALACLAVSPLAVVIVTNQSAIGRGLLPFGKAQEINRQVLEAIQQAGGRVDGLYMCPHTPAEACDCRKPRPGLLLQAAHELRLDLSHSFMVGDALTDLIAAEQAGVPERILVLTGRGISQAQLPQVAELSHFHTLPALNEAVAFILNQKA